MKQPRREIKPLKMDPTAVVEDLKREHPVTSRPGREIKFGEPGYLEGADNIPTARQIEPRRAVTESQPRKPRDK
jgi:hypothetical protein